MVLGSAVVLVVAAAVLFTLFVRKQDLPAPEPLSPTRHLEERKAAIYENLRDLQFEYRVGKLSDADYQQTKLGLQKELAGVIAQIEQMDKQPAAAVAAAATTATVPATTRRLSTKPMPRTPLVNIWDRLRLVRSSGTSPQELRDALRRHVEHFGDVTPGQASLAQPPCGGPGLGGCLPLCLIGRGHGFPRSASLLVKIATNLRGYSHREPVGWQVLAPGDQIASHVLGIPQRA